MDLLPTPTAGDGKSAGSRNLEGSKAHDGVSLTDAILHGNSNTPRRTSACSPGSAAWISRWKRSGLPRSDRSSGTPTVPVSSSDGGRLFPVGEMSPTSPLLPSPNAGAANYDEDPATWFARREELKAKGINGNGAGLPLGVAVRSISSAEDSLASPSQPLAGERPKPIRAGYGPSSPVWLASFDPERCSSRTCESCGQPVPESTSAGMGWTRNQASLFGDWHSERFSETWPRSGMTRRGEAFALPRSARPTDENGSSYSLPTPASRDYKGRDLESREGGSSLPARMEELLPTPKTPTGGSEARGPREARGSGGEDLEARLRSLGDLMSPLSDDGSES